MSRPEISVVMPVFNGGAVLDRAIRSIVHQSFTEWELIAGDDGSTDDTADILAQWAQRDARVQPLYAQHCGIVDALNAGLEVARAPLIARMDADDEAMPTRFADQLSLMRERPELGVVGSLVEFGGEGSQSEGYAAHVEWMNTIVSSDQISLNRFIESPFAHPSVMFRRALVERHGGYRNGSFPEDFELWLRWLDAGVCMAKVNKVLLRWNDSPNRLSRSHLRYSTDAFYRCKARFLSKWLKEHVSASRPVIIWGAGRPTRKRAEFLVEYGVQIAAYIDIDPAKQGAQFASRPVLTPEQIPREAFAVGYVANRGARELIRANLRSLGRQEGRDFLMAA